MARRNSTRASSRGSSDDQDARDAWGADDYIARRMETECDASTLGSVKCRVPRNASEQNQQQQQQRDSLMDQSMPKQHVRQNCKHHQNREQHPLSIAQWPTHSHLLHASTSNRNSNLINNRRDFNSHGGADSDDSMGDNTRSSDGGGFQPASSDDDSSDRHAYPDDVELADSEKDDATSLSPSCSDKNHPRLVPRKGDIAYHKDAESSSKTSRYLREMDRRDILQRISKGEKQSVLAKEYNISRSAVCNLHRKRHAILSRKVDNPLAKHPKINTRAASKSKPTAFHLSRIPTTTASGSSTINDHHGGGLYRGSNQLNVLALSNRAAALLLTRVYDHDMPQVDFQRCVNRLMRLVLEDAMASIAIRAVEIAVIDSTSDSEPAAKPKFHNVVASYPTCAISMGQDGSSMLDLFMVLEPDQPLGYARVDVSWLRSGSIMGNTKDSESLSRMSTPPTVTILQAHLPQNLHNYNVLLLDTVAVPGDVICAVIAKVVIQMGAVETRIAVAALMISREAVESIANSYPQVRVIAATLDSSDEQGDNESFRRRLKALM